VSHQTPESGKTDACRNVPSSGFSEKGHSRRSLSQRIRRYFGKPENVISLLTLATVVVYTSLTYGLLNAERESYTRVQRAFVFPAEYVFRLEGPGRRIAINAVWKNGGDTPTRNLNVSITERRREAALPSDFDFPSDDQKIYGGHPLPILVLGPHASVSAMRGAEIPLSAVPDIDSGKELFYLWGYARYHDVFGAPHITRYCVQITSIKTDFARSSSDVTGAYIFCDRGNCADEECEAEKIPLPNPRDGITTDAAP
jgi:hypothetical protein